MLTDFFCRTHVKRGKYFEARDKKKKSGEITKKIIITMVVLTISSGLLEFLYEIGGKYSPKNATSYIFVIDDSGSMQSNDSANERIFKLSTLINLSCLHYSNTAPTESKLAQ